MILLKEQLFSKRTFLAQVLSLERKCDVRGMFDEEAAKGILLSGVVMHKLIFALITSCTFYVHGLPVIKVLMCNDIKTNIEAKS